MPDSPEEATRKRRAADLAVRVGAVKDDLAALLVEVQREEPFFGSFHAINGLRQARTYVNDCLVRLMELASDSVPVAPEPAETEPTFMGFMSLPELIEDGTDD